jgi:hypothetical protein
MESCRAEGCTQTVSRAGFALCLNHWKAEKNGQLRRCERCPRYHAADRPLCAACAAPSAVPSAATPPTSDDADAPTGYLSSTKIGQHFGVSGVKVNLILAELGWIEKYVKGWLPTDSGNAVGANVREARNGVPFVVWPDSVLRNAAFLASVNEQVGRPPAMPPLPAAAHPAEPAQKDNDFRAKFPANFRTQDGHQVRSRAEVLIDNWLYMQGLVHAYERRLPIEEECYCDFYLPGGKGVYIEYWGLEADPKYRDRKAAKQALYAKYNLRLIELGDAEIERLDDVLPRMLLKFGIDCA